MFFCWTIECDPAFEECAMVKLGLWLGTPPLITFLASSYSVRIENALFVFALCVVAVIIGIGPRLTRKKGQ